MANIGWTNEKVLKFIRLYREKRILWDPNNGDYYNKNLKHEAWKDISLRMGCDLLELRRKMDYLMAGLRREKMKLTKARQSGIGRTVSTWFAYDPLKFLLGRTKSKEMIKKSEKWLAYENLKEEILEKIRKLEEERHTVDLWSTGPEWGRKRRRRQVTVSPPYVVYMLPDADIMEDWRLVRKLLERTD